ncbi:hypothetical protein DPMN_061273 [Dreissena polymorpha]|uniref:Uncharacterized protein n=1 Tax=Dreissena polymorpha TaxID=45954 RepID=A0A9D4C7M9_DREPO|nr:hypothetical protein DPMN_061273 [Dreissena polymorpha]
MNIASRVLTGTYAPPTGGHVFQPTLAIFELIQDAIGRNFLIKCHKDRTIIVASRVLTRSYYSHKMKHALTPDIIAKNLLTQFHEHRTINVASRVVYYIPYIEKCPLTRTIFKLIQDIIR